MGIATVVKTVGTTGVFSTPQLWEDGAPVNLTTAEKSAAGTFLVAAFAQGESLSFVGSGATGKLLDTDSTGVGSGTYVTYGITAGNPAASDVVTGDTSGATCVLSSSTAIDVGVIWQGQQQNQEFSSATTVLTISGSTVSSSAYKEYTTVAGASFSDNANVQTNALRYNASNGAAINHTSSTGSFNGIAITETNVRVSKIQIRNNSTANSPLALGAGSSSAIIDKMLFDGDYSNTGSSVGIIGFSGTATSGTIIKNCLAVQRTSGAHHIIGTGAATASFYNCTFVAPDDLAKAPVSIFLSGASGTLTVQNCGMFAGDSTKAIKAGSATFNFTTCHSDITGTAGVTQVTYTNQFQNINDATLDLRLKTGADMLNSGTTDATNAAVDIAGTSRPSGASYDTGCWELVSAGGADVRNHIIPAYMRIAA